MNFKFIKKNMKNCILIYKKDHSIVYYVQLFDKLNSKNSHFYTKDVVLLKFITS